MNRYALICRTINNNSQITQRELAEKLDISLGNANKYIKECIEEGYLTLDKGEYHLTKEGKKFLELFRVDNAVIFAAGFGSRFVPLTFETPKGLLEVLGERMIERQIKQLHEVGIHKITIVVGYLKEKFEYLIDKYKVELLYNPEYATKNNLATLYHSRHLFKNTYLLSSDNWMRENIFHTYEAGPWYSSVFQEGETSEWCLTIDKKNRITDVNVGGWDSYVMYGPVYFDKEFSKNIIPFIEEAYERPGTEDFYWENIYMENISDLTMYAYKQQHGIVYEFENLEELRLFDTKYQTNSENHALECIAKIFSISENEITKLKILKAGMTNKSFLFTVKEKDYIFRIPGPGTDMLINRSQEKACYDAIGDLKISDFIVYFDRETGYKISEYYTDCRNCDGKNKEDVAASMKFLRDFHQCGKTVDHEFNLRERIDYYEKICKEHNSIRFEDYEETRVKMNELLALLEKRNPKKALAHIDSVESNLLFLPDGSIRLIDWEYAGMCDPLIDPAMFSIYSYLEEDEIKYLMEQYFGRKPTNDEAFRVYAYIALSGFLWSLWAEYKSSLGDEFGEYTLLMYRYAKIYYKKSLNLI